ncbi:hypothetical protein [Allomuricauda sp. M10]|uniref:hypothetical protein n=1 Tax=Allomuricauda sp. M10 TaxID=2683292 RepID=UPI001D18F90B|nr:hypothetical protein [Muricauda sp. M10]
MKTIKLLSIAILTMAMSMVSCSGDDGEQGPQGAPGKDGTNGTNGVDGTDGTNGVDGQDGQDKPNVDFYFQNGFKGYEGTQDVRISDAFGDLNGAINAIADFGDPAFDAYTLIRFDGISEIITGSLVDGGQNCSDAFYVNQAVLYVYFDSFQTDSPTLSLQLGFYNPSDPLFTQVDASWEHANQTEFWSGGDGGLSANWVGPFPNSDNYGVVLPVSGGSSNDPGWYAIPLPRSIVNEWICNEAANKGVRMRLAINGGTTGTVSFFSSENLADDLRPVLVIETEKIDAQSGKGSFSNTKTKDWENLTYEEQMAPLHKFLEMKKTN